MLQFDFHKQKRIENYIVNIIKSNAHFCNIMHIHKKGITKLELQVLLK